MSLRNAGNATPEAIQKFAETNLELASENRRLREALDRITATAGHPDAAEGCRLILGIARAALAGARDDGGGGKA